jgi:acyl carrier protein
MKNTLETIREILASQLGVNAATITETTTITEDLGADSLDQIELIMEIEEAFGIDMEEDDAARIRTVGDAVAVVDRLKSGIKGDK